MELWEFINMYNERNLIENIKTLGYDNLAKKIFHDAKKAKQGYKLRQIKEYLEYEYPGVLTFKVIR